MNICPAVQLQDELMSSSTTARWNYVRQYYCKMNLYPAVLLRDEVLSGLTTSQWTCVLQYYFKMILFSAVLIQDEIMSSNTTQDELTSGSTTSGWTYVQQSCRNKESFDQLHNCVLLTTEGKSQNFVLWRLIFSFLKTLWKPTSMWEVRFSPLFSNTWKSTALLKIFPV